MDGHDDNNGNSDAVNSTRQAIFTPNTPPPTIPSQNAKAPVITGSVVEPASTGLSHPVRSIASGSGDIIVGKGKMQGGVNWRKWMIAGISAAVVLILSFVILSMMFSSKDSNKMVLQAFNRYANYFLYGDDNDAPLDEAFSVYERYEIDQHLNDINSPFWSRSSELLNNAVDKSEGLDNINAMLVAYKQNFELLKYIYQINPPAISDIIERHSDTDDAFSGYIDEVYQSIVLLESNNSMAGVYMRYVRELQQARLDLVMLYENAGCISEERLDYACLAQQGDSNIEQMNIIYISIKENAAAITAVTKSIIADLKQQCWHISQFISEEITSDER